MLDTLLCIILSIIIGVSTVMIIFNTWRLICNERTYRKRMELLDAVQTVEDWTKGLRYSTMIMQVKYDRHLDCLVWFRDWRVIYKQELRDAFPELFK